MSFELWILLEIGNLTFKHEIIKNYPAEGRDPAKGTLSVPKAVEKIKKLFTKLKITKLKIFIYGGFKKRKNEN